MKKKLLKFSKKLLTVFLILFSICLFCLFDYGKTTVKNSSENDFMTHDDYVNIEDISPYAINAIVDIEDNTFWTNPGINIKGLGRAATIIIKSKGERIVGGSSITQQLVKNVFLNQDVNITRKVKEMSIAIQLDNKYSKRQILEFYFNNSYFANGCYTIESASKLYFGKPVKDVSLSEAAYLCAILNSPTHFNPYKDVNAAIPRRNQILEKMFQMGDISQEEYNTAINESIVLKEDNNETK